MVSSLITLVLLPALALSAPLTAVPRATNSTGGGKVSFKNNCPYTVSVEPFPGSGCYAGKGGSVSSGSSWSDKLSECNAGNTALKVYKADDSYSASKPMQFEYGLSSGTLWYDMSFIDCIKSGQDVSSCAGTKWAMKSNEKCQAWKCTGPDCCQQGYCDPKASTMSQEPTSGCGPNEGYNDPSALNVEIELC